MDAKYKSRLMRLAHALVVVILVGCATNRDVVPHGFFFNFITESPEAELIDYRYGESKNPAARSYRELYGRTKQGGGTYGAMLRGDELYVKWRLKTTGEVFEQTVDLRKRLPEKIEGCEISFLVHGDQLYVYLIMPERRGKDELPIGPKVTQYRKTVVLYPDPVQR